nr:hypothetical protein [Tanacetum cinerariifolium]
AREKHIKNLEELLEDEADMKDIAEAKNVELVKEFESLCIQFSDLQVSNHQLSQQVSTLQAQVTGEERIKAAFEEFKKYEDDRVIEHGLRIAIMKCVEPTELRQVFADVVSAGIAKGMSEGLKHGVDHKKDKVDLVAIKAYNPEADTKYVAALHALKDLKYPLVDQLEKLKDAPIDVIMSSLYLESDSGEDAPQWIRELQEILLKDATAANISRAEKKRSVVWCAVPMRLVPPTMPDAATQTDITKDEASPKLLRSKFLPPMYNLDWP